MFNRNPFTTKPYYNSERYGQIKLYPSERKVKTYSILDYYNIYLYTYNNYQDLWISLTYLHKEK